MYSRSSSNDWREANQSESASHFGRNSSTNGTNTQVTNSQLRSAYDSNIDNNSSQGIKQSTNRSTSNYTTPSSLSIRNEKSSVLNPNKDEKIKFNYENSTFNSTNSLSSNLHNYKKISSSEIPKGFILTCSYKGSLWKMKNPKAAKVHFQTRLNPEYFANNLSSSSSSSKRFNGKSNLDSNVIEDLSLKASILEKVFFEKFMVQRFQKSTRRDEDIQKTKIIIEENDNSLKQAWNELIEENSKFKDLSKGFIRIPYNSKKDWLSDLNSIPTPNLDPIRAEELEIQASHIASGLTQDTNQLTDLEINNLRRAYHRLQPRPY
ncbi:uncharacterized protein I206_103840 [Kwoniella pini CBS 10737]|uniref:Uncharacterized protein n=1 Tax=Kwoniella pini CBS 10737 TaxID=1296096 RepID=A0A1B9HSQ9_9TREE|nr:uncharacterized protein I206_07793 [Kwoniella pini CBS 10737]OCF46312.1 hypothetical protein I206_07793 [Kwoniella pini CBS 10737]